MFSLYSRILQLYRYTGTAVPVQYAVLSPYRKWPLLRGHFLQVGRSTLKTYLSCARAPILMSRARNQIWTSVTIYCARAQYSRNSVMHELCPAFRHHFHAAHISQIAGGHFCWLRISYIRVLHESESERAINCFSLLYVYMHCACILYGKNMTPQERSFLLR